MSGVSVLGVLTVFLLVFSSLITGYSSPHVNITCYSSVSSVLASRFPRLSSYVDLSNYTVVSSNLNYTDLIILVFKWISRGVSVEVQATKETCEIVSFEVVIDVRYVNESSILNELEGGVKEWYNTSKKLISSTSRAEVLGGQLVIGDAPIYFLDLNYVTATPIVVRYFIYPSPPLVIYKFINYFPAIRELLTQIPNFNLSVGEVEEILKNKLNITEYRGIIKSYVILYGMLRPAYVVAVTPYKNIAILADNGEIITQKTTTTQAIPESNQLTTYLGLALILTVLALATTYVVRLKKHHS
ncbi:MAG: hypothetical protein QN229_02580 [Desulfurococcaceae archaeon TW002]